MKISVCGTDCGKCIFGGMCKGCRETHSCPFGRECFIARYIALGGKEGYRQFVQQLIGEINALQIPGMPQVKSLYPMAGRLINPEIPLPNGETVKLLDDRGIYLGTQLESDFDGERYFVIAAGMDFLLVYTCGERQNDAELTVFKKR